MYKPPLRKENQIHKYILKMIHNKGFVLLLSLIVLSVVLTASLGVFNILIKGLELSGTTRESQLAFYAADGGVECALYIDFKGNYSFGTTTAPSIEECSNSRDLNYLIWSSSYVDGARFSIDFDNGSCVDIKVDKSGAGTIIESIGRNTCDEVPRRVNRSLRVEY